MGVQVVLGHKLSSLSLFILNNPGPHVNLPILRRKHFRKPFDLLEIVQLAHRLWDQS